ncbi:MAG: Ig-like domain-containing protein [bacterium]|nr:Ig-like domain-containing protein [bacterium]
MKPRKLYLKEGLLLALSLLGIGSCQNRDNGHRETYRAQVSLDLPWSQLPDSRAQITGAGTLVVYAVDASRESVNNREAITGAFDRALADASNNQVVLDLPLDTSMRLIKAQYPKAVTAAQLTQLRPIRIGLSDVFSVAADTQELTLPIGLHNAPQVASMVPADAATQVALTTQIALEFTEPLAGSTVTTNLTGPQCSGSVQVSADQFFTCVPMTSQPVASNSGKTFSLTPAAPLAENTTYRIKLTEDLRDLLDNGPPAEYVTQGFSTGLAIDRTAPSATSLYPASGATSVAITTQLGLQFSEALNPATLTVSTSGTACTGSVQVSKDDFATCVPFSAQATAASGNQSFLWSFLSPLEYETTYKIKVLRSIKDTSGNALDKQYLSSGFTTQAPAVPTLVSSIPADGTLGVHPSSSLSVTFSEAMDPSTLTLDYGCNGTVQVSSDDFANCAALASPMVASNGNKTFTISSAELNNGTTYKIRVTSAAKSALGKYLSATQTQAQGFTVYAGFGALYSNAAQWMDFYKNDDTTTTPIPSPYKASNTACAGTETGWQACLHGGERFVVSLPSSVASCTGVTATDALGAFDWECLSGPVRIVSKGLANQKHLSDLIDWTVSPLAFKDNAVSIRKNGTLVLQTAAGKWWSNPIVENSTALNATGTIYAFTSNPGTNLTLGTAKTAVVVKPGVTLTGATGNVITLSQKFAWVEGTINASTGGSAYGLSGSAANFAVLRNLTVSGASSQGVYLASSTGTRLESISVSGSGSHGLYLNGAHYASLYDLKSFGNGGSGFDLRSNGARARKLRLHNNTSHGLSGFTGGSWVQFIDLVASNNNGSGVSWWGDVNHAFFGLVASNNGAAAITSFQATHLLYLNATLANSGSNGINLSYSYNNSYINSVAVNSAVHGLATGTFGTYGQWVDVASGQSGNTGYSNTWMLESNADGFLGLLLFGGNSTDCAVSFLQKVAGINSSCVGANPPSNFVLRQNQPISSAFVGLVGANDTTNNTTQTLGEAAVGSITDWSSFENSYRAWGKSGGSSFATTHRGRCTTGNCAVWDYSLKATDSTLRAVHTTLPTGNDVNRQIWNAINKAACDQVPGAVWTGSCSNGTATTAAACSTALATWTIAGSCSHPAISAQATCTSWGWCSDTTKDISGTCVSTCSDTNQTTSANCVNTCTEALKTTQSVCGVCSNPAMGDNAACIAAGATWTTWTWAAGVCSDPAKNTQLKCGTCSNGTSLDSTACGTAAATWTAQTWAARTWSARTWHAGDWNSTEKCVSTFLNHAVEILDDSIGNENGLCESNEACLLTPNIGAYQGHGALVSAGTFTNGTLTGISLYRYSTNGH